MDLASILDLEDLGNDRFRGRTPPDSVRADIFGGQVAGQALRAASFTVVPEHLPNSVHGYFLRRGQSTLPIDIHVERTRAGRTYTSRRVDVRQEGKTIFAMLASFHADEPGREFDHPMPEGIPDPDSLVPDSYGTEWHPGVEVRTIESDSPTLQWWGRASPPYPRQAVMHYCGLLYASDMRAGAAALAAIGVESRLRPEHAAERVPVGNIGSLDHALWFHRTPRADEWFFCDVRPLTIRDSRGLVLGRMFDAEGRHLATFTQEIFLKLEGDG